MFRMIKNYELKSSYYYGNSIKELAKQYGMSHAGIHKRLKGSKTIFRNKRGIIKVDVNLMRKLSEEGKFLGEAAKNLNVSETILAKRAKENRIVFLKKKKERKRTEVNLIELKELYERGLPIENISIVVGIHPGIVYSRIKELRRLGQLIKRKQRWYRDPDWCGIKSLRKNGSLLLIQN